MAPVDEVVYPMTPVVFAGIEIVIGLVVVMAKSEASRLAYVTEIAVIITFFFPPLEKDNTILFPAFSPENE